MAKLEEIVNFCDELLDAQSFEDYCPNGLQVPGRDEVKTIVSGVSASLELFERAAELDGDLILAHHGLIWGRTPTVIDRAAKRRLELLFSRDCSLLAYHLPLDGHSEIGNNALIAAEIGCERQQPFGELGAKTIGVAGFFGGEGISITELAERTAAACGGREPLVFDGGPAQIRSVAVVSGAGSSYLDDAIRSGFDAFITGEPAERVMNESREGAIHFIAAGHYATETLGVQRLGGLIAERFSVSHQFVDIPNPI
jgi:dinuclear metal center YbgI/SA1388 family protein